MRHHDPGQFVLTSTNFGDTRRIFIYLLFLSERRRSFIIHFHWAENQARSNLFHCANNQALLYSYKRYQRKNKSMQTGLLYAKWIRFNLFCVFLRFYSGFVGSFLTVVAFFNGNSRWKFIQIWLSVRLTNQHDNRVVGTKMVQKPFTSTDNRCNRSLVSGNLLSILHLGDACTIRKYWLCKAVDFE